MGKMVLEYICLSINNAGAFTILADETKDCSKKEQLAIIILYVNVDDAKLYEKFLSYVVATVLDITSLLTFILDTLRNNNLDLDCVGYDGASVMSGHCSGIQQKNI